MMSWPRLPTAATRSIYSMTATVLQDTYKNNSNRLETATTAYDDTVEVAEYTYNDNGIRVSKYTWSEIGGVPQNDDVTVVYLIDAYNHTGYAQTLEEKTFNYAEPDPLIETPDSLTTYLIGDDVIAQTVDGSTQYLLYDGHGSTRQLAEYDTAVTIADSYSYDGYGVMLQDETAAQNDPGYTPQQDTNLLYAGEYFDSDSQQYYNRARWYNPLNGRFNRMDTYPGSPQDPQSLHKYLYAHNNPINAIDPSGRTFTVVGTLGALSISQMIFAAVALTYVAFPGVRNAVGDVVEDMVEREIKLLIAMAATMAKPLPIVKTKNWLF